MTTCSRSHIKTSPESIARFTLSFSDRGPFPIPRKRQIANQHHRIFSVKAGMNIVVAEGQLEANAIFWAEGEPEVVALCEQPLRIHGSYGTSKYHTLDLSVTYKNGKEIFYEIRRKNRLVEHEDGRLLPAYWELIEAWGSANGYDIRIMTDEWFDPFLIRIQNWKALIGFVRYFRDHRDPDLEREVCAVIANYPGSSIASILDHVVLENEQLITSCVASLLHEGHITGSVDQKQFNRYRKLEIHDKS